MTVSLASRMLKCYNKRFPCHSLSYCNHLHCKIVSAEGAHEALSLGGTMLGYYPVRVLPSKTAILPVNPTFLPRVIKHTYMFHYFKFGFSFQFWIYFDIYYVWCLMQSEDEREMCSRTIYCTNIDKKVKMLTIL